MDGNVEHEICANCKKEIPQHNYVMHTMHCARNITLCKICNEPIPKSQFEDHQKTCIPKPVKVKKVISPPIALENSSYFQQRKAVEDQKAAVRRENYIKKHERLVDTGFSLKSGSSSNRSEASVNSEPQRVSRVNSYAQQNGSVLKEEGSNILKPSGAVAKQSGGRIVSADQNGGAKPKTGSSSGLLACKYCELELPKLDLDEHENYCGSRTDKCLECGELVMYKYKQIHMDSNHGFLKLKDEPGPRATWDSSTQRSPTSSSITSNNYESPTRRRFERFRPFGDLDYDPAPYLPSSYSPSSYSPSGAAAKKKEGESYKEISRRLDCPAPQPPIRRRNPPTELVIPCEFCNVPVPHDDLIEHETGCRPDLARFNPRRRSTEEDDYFIAPQPTSPEVELPCEFCADMIPASQLLRHQATCVPA